MDVGGSLWSGRPDNSHTAVTFFSRLAARARTVSSVGCFDYFISGSLRILKCYYFVCIDDVIL